MQSDSFLPDWLEEGTESLLRDSVDDAHSNSNVTVVPIQPLKGSPRLESFVALSASSASSADPNTSSKGPWTDLDKFYQEDDDDEHGTQEESAVDGTDGSLESDMDTEEDNDTDSDEDDEPRRDT